MMSPAENERGWVWDSKMFGSFMAEGVGGNELESLFQAATSEL
jgi:hypothetical protein